MGDAVAVSDVRYVDGHSSSRIFERDDSLRGRPHRTGEKSEVDQRRQIAVSLGQPRPGRRIFDRDDLEPLLH